MPATHVESQYFLSYGQKVLREGNGCPYSVLWISPSCEVQMGKTKTRAIQGPRKASLTYVICDQAFFFSRGKGEEEKGRKNTPDTFVL